MKKALIIEDEPIIALDTKRKLKNGLIDSVISIDLDDIISIINTEDIDIILADIDLPGQYDGIEIVNKIQDLKRIPVIFLTAYDEDDILERATMTHPFAYLLKPFDEKELRITVDLTIYRHQVEQKLLYKEKWVKSVVDNISDAIIVTDLDGCITFSNKLAEEFLDFKFCELDTKSFHSMYTLLDVEHRPFSKDIIKRVIENNAATTLTNVKLAKNDDVLCHVDCNFSPFIDHENKSDGVIISFKKVKRLTTI